MTRNLLPTKFLATLTVVSLLAGGSLVAIAAVLYFLVFRGFVDAWFAQFGELF